MQLWRMWSVVTRVQIKYKITVQHRMWQHFCFNGGKKHALRLSLEVFFIFQRELLVYGVCMGEGHQEDPFLLTSDVLGSGELTTL